MSHTHKLHAIFHDKAKAERAKAIMAETGMFPTDRIFLVHVPTLIDTESTVNRPRSRMPRVMSRTVTGGVVGAGIALAGAASLFMVQAQWPISSPVRALSLTAALGASIGMLGTRLLSRREPAAAGESHEIHREGNWVLIAHARSEREASIARELLANTKLSRSLRVRRYGSPAEVSRRPCVAEDGEHAA